MTTTAQVKRAVQPLLQQHADLALVGRWIVVRPVRHLVRAILIDRTGSADNFMLKWCVMHLFEVRSFICLNWGRDLYAPYKGQWKWSRPEAIPALHGAIEQTLPRLRSIETISDVVRELPDLWYIGRPWEMHPLDFQVLTKLIFDVALGNLDAARTICAQQIAPRDVATFGRDDEDKAALRRLKELCRCLASDDRTGLAALLHAWEAETVTNLKLERLWEPTPFPLELQSGSAPARAG